MMEDEQNLKKILTNAHRQNVKVHRQKCPKTAGKSQTQARKSIKIQDLYTSLRLLKCPTATSTSTSQY